ncbi:MAG: polysaccharide deacetylase [Candidatus Marinimicrobia bacterium CG08_land_8_20_14_0_20_45_22]|nr:MAG: polysaccharide deacetylase [Candidatus Marinimicrobia bacterium CG08_land_8_20_14_0_20_45_22]
MIRYSKNLLLIYFGLIIFALCGSFGLFVQSPKNEGKYSYACGGIVRGDRSVKTIALIFTGADFYDGGEIILNTLKERNIRATFFFTGDFYRNAGIWELIQKLVHAGHYLGPHSDKHLLYCSWEKRDSLLVDQAQFQSDLLDNYREMERFGIDEKHRYFMPPYEWYNDSVTVWAKQMGITLINYTPGTLSSADYTIPSMKNYRSNHAIFQSILDYEKEDPNGLNGFFLLTHIGTHPERTEKFYNRLGGLLDILISKGYRFVKINEMF